MTATSHLRARHNRCMNMGDALGIAIYRISLADHVVVYDRDTGQRWTHGQRHRYRQSAAYKARRARIVARRRCDACGSPGASVLSGLRCPTTSVQRITTTPSCSAGTATTASTELVSNSV